MSSSFSLGNIELTGFVNFFKDGGSAPRQAGEMFNRTFTVSVPPERTKEGKPKEDQAYTSFRVTWWSKNQEVVEKLVDGARVSVSGRVFTHVWKDKQTLSIKVNENDLRVVRWPDQIEQVIRNACTAAGQPEAGVAAQPTMPQHGMGDPTSGYPQASMPPQPQPGYDPNYGQQPQPQPGFNPGYGQQPQMGAQQPQSQPGFDPNYGQQQSGGMGSGQFNPPVQGNPQQMVPQQMPQPGGAAGMTGQMGIPVQSTNMFQNPI